MRRSALIRAGALMAVAGGALRAGASFAPTLIQSDLARESLYVVVDACLAAGLLAVHSLRPQRAGRWRTAGLTLALAGIATVRANRLISTTDLYPAGALRNRRRNNRSKRQRVARQADSRLGTSSVRPLDVSGSRGNAFSRRRCLVRRVRCDVRHRVRRPWHRHLDLSIRLSRTVSSDVARLMRRPTARPVQRS